MWHLRPVPETVVNLHLISLIRQSFGAFCDFLDAEEENLIAVPHWNGSVLRYRQREVPVRTQSGAPLPMILNEFQKNNWVESVLAPDFDPVNLKQAVHYLNDKQKLIRFSRSGNFIRWVPQF